MQNMKHAVFSVGEYDYGFDIKDVKSIEEVIPVEVKANMPSGMKGIIKLRDEILPVCSLRSKFGIGDIAPGEESRYIITSSHDMLIAYEVDEMKEIIDTEPEMHNEVPSIYKSEDTLYMKCIINVEGKLIIILNPDTILTEAEFDQLKLIIKK